MNSKETFIPFISEVEEFNEVMGKGWQNRTEPNIVEIFDALLDITYVGLGNGALVFGLKDRIVAGYAEVQASNMSKICSTVEEAEETVKVRSEQQGEPCHFEPVGDKYVVYRSSDNKVMKSINYFRPNLKQYFTQDEIDSCKK